jgi:TetR/AcrR family transcriptional repressor of nem operon
LARHVQAVIQGAFVLAKTQPEECAADLAREQLAHLRRYFALLLHREERRPPDDLD